MGNPLPNARYERKFVAQRASLAEALALVRRHPGAFREAYPPRVVNNIYLDSPFHTAYYDHINGASQRVKHRVRWYGALHGPIPHPVLERKLKAGSVSGKEAESLAPFELNGQPIIAALENALDGAELPGRLRAELRHLVPCLINQYRRHYFVSGDRRFRLTVDSDFQFGHPNLGARVFPASRRAPSVVLELKYEIQHETCAETVTNALPFRLARCSKFILGLEGA